MNDSHTNDSHMQDSHVQDRRLTSAAATLSGLVGPCPECGNGRLEAVTDGELTNLLCSACGACWHPEVALVHRVDPAACRGCSSRSLCRAAVPV